MRRYGSRRYNGRPRRTHRRGFRRLRRAYGRSSRRTAGRRRLSRRGIVNLCARKKRDNMIACAIDAGGVPGPAGLPFVMTAGATYNFAFVPSARTFHANSSIQQQRAWDYTRQSTYTYSVGYSERVTLVANSSANWRWRRIVFTMKNLEPAQSFQSGALFNYNTSVEPEPGYVRTMYNFANNTLSRQLLFREIFQGTQGVDYSDPFNAPLDPTRIRILYDKNISVASGNDAAHWRVRRFYHRNNSRLIYNEKETGDHKDTGSEASHYNNSSRLGQGDLWVVDMFACAGGSGSDELRFLPQGTYYWHERA
ncbi:MAG: capsid protein [Gemykibivirus mouti2]|uniref:capsid protein n=1 Tax=Genomoviridae sp. TaxID=2202565 RepID=UPI00248208EC|nr:MAG: capsid protein [Genomoviridae sp.]QCW23717.1 MAG: capsid protein [Genomoviridae sp.]